MFYSFTLLALFTLSSEGRRDETLEGLSSFTLFTLSSEGSLEGQSTQTLSRSPCFSSLCARSIGVHPEQVGAFNSLSSSSFRNLQTFQLSNLPSFPRAIPCRIRTYKNPPLTLLECALSKRRT